jgi:putative ABC transport system ATP-binding protein
MSAVGSEAREQSRALVEHRSPGRVLVEIEGLAKSYRRGAEVIHVFQDVNLEIREGEFLALMGPSGSGKSTLLNILAGLDTPDRGRVVVDGQDVTAMNGRRLAAWRSTHVGFIFQFYNLLPVLTAAQNVELPLLLTRLSKKQRRDHVMAALEVVGLTDRAEHFPRQLSGGQQQRVGIARAIVSDPVMILADEPTGDLDAASGKEVLDLLQRLSAEFGKTILMVTHDAHAAERAQAIMHLDKGVLSR